MVWPRSPDLGRAGLPALVGSPWWVEVPGVWSVGCVDPEGVGAVAIDGEAQVVVGGVAGVGPSAVMYIIFNGRIWRRRHGFATHTYTVRIGT